MTSQQPNRASHAIHSRHVGSFFALSGIGKSHKICSHSLLLNLHKAKLHLSNNVINIYSLTPSLTCSNKISKKLKHIFLYRATQKNIQHGVGTKCARGAYRVVKTLYIYDLNTVICWRAHHTKSLRILCNVYSSGIKTNEFCAFGGSSAEFCLLSSAKL